MFVWEQTRWAPWTAENIYFVPLAYQRTGPGKALDGGLKFDLTRFNQEYFDRLRSRVIHARDRGIYVCIMLFNGWSIEKKRPWAELNNPWRGHPFNRSNNANNIDGDLNGDGEGPEVHALGNPAVTALQDTYVKKVVNTVNDLDNVLYEIANESTSGSVPWQNHMIDLIHSYEATKPKRHPVLFTCAWGHDGSELWMSGAEAISPGWPYASATFVPYRDDPPANNGQKVIINDTDHLWGTGGERAWVWKSFLRGLNPIYMDPYDEALNPTDYSMVRYTRDDVVRSMGFTRLYSNKINLAAMIPHNELCSSAYCLVNPGKEYLLYLPSKGHRGLTLLDRFYLHGVAQWLTRPLGLNGSVTVDLSPVSGSVVVEWFNPRTGEIVAGQVTTGGARRAFTAPFTGDAVLYLRVPTPIKEP